MTKTDPVHHVGDALLAGLLLDACERLAMVLMSEDSVGVSVSRYDELPAQHLFREEMHQKIWIVVFRDEGEEIFVSSKASPANDGEVYELKSPQERESVQFAMEVALGAWPEWCPHLRERVSPRSPIVLHKEVPIA